MTARTVSVHLAGVRSGFAQGGQAAVQGALTVCCTCVQSPGERHGPANRPRLPGRAGGPPVPRRLPPGGARAGSAERSASPREPQVGGLAAHPAGEDVLIAAPTGSGKTLTAFLAALDGLFRLAAARGSSRTRRGCSTSRRSRRWATTCRRTCSQPLEELMSARAAREGYTPQEIRVQVRTGDTRPPSARRWCAGRRTSSSPRPSRSTSTSPPSAPARRCAARAHRDRRRDPRAGARQARHPLRALARAAQGASPRCARSSSACPPRRSRWSASPPSSPARATARCDAGAGRPPAAVGAARRDARRRARRRWPPTRCGARSTTGSVELAERAPHHAHLRQHPQAGRARGARSRRAARRRTRSPRTTAAWRASCASRPRSGSRRGSSR